MKPENTDKRFPKTDSKWETLLAEAPGEVRETPAEYLTELDEGVAVVRNGRFESVRSELQAVRRKRGERGRQKAPTKEHITIRLSTDVVTQFRASGAGWQTRIDKKALQEWLEEHPFVT